MLKKRTQCKRKVRSSKRRTGRPKRVVRQRQFTLEELQQYDGSNGRPAYVAVDGIVYDVTNNPAWTNGMHASLTAGRDLTNEFNNCHAKTLLTGLPVVGVLL